MNDHLTYWNDEKNFVKRSVTDKEVILVEEKVFSLRSRDSNPHQLFHLDIFLMMFKLSKFVNYLNIFQSKKVVTSIRFLACLS